MSETESAPQAAPVLPGLEPQEVLRSEVKAIMAAESKAASVVAREANIAPSTFSAWLNDTYAGDNKVQADKVRGWLQARRAAHRTRAVMPAAPGFQMTRSAEMMMAALEHAQHAPDMVLITGEPGVGKTQTCEEYGRQFSSVFFMTMQPAWSSPGMLLDYMVDVLRIGEGGSKQKRTSAIMARLRDSRGLLLVDEAQHLSSSSIDQLRSFHDLAKVGVALVGNETVSARVEGDGRRAHFAQLYSRIGMRVKRNAPYKADVNTLLDAWGVETPAERDLLHAIARKPGALRGMTKTLRAAFMQASVAGRSAVNSSDITRAWSQISSTEIQANAA